MTHPLSVEGETPLKTWQLFALIVLANLVATWLYNERILTREIYHSLLSDQVEAESVDQYFNFVRRLSRWGYLAQPVIVWLQIAFIALVIQMPLLLMFTDIPFHRLFRSVTYAHLAVTASAFARILWLSRLEPWEISHAALNHIPLSLASVLDTTRLSIASAVFVNKFNVFELIWCVIIYKELAAPGKLRKEKAALLIASLWALLVLLQWAAIAYLSGVSG